MTRDTPSSFSKRGRSSRSRGSVRKSRGTLEKERTCSSSAVVGSARFIQQDGENSEVSLRPPFSHLYMVIIASPPFLGCLLLIKNGAEFITNSAKMPTEKDDFYHHPRNRFRASSRQQQPNRNTGFRSPDICHASKVHAEMAPSPHPR